MSEPVKVEWPFAPDARKKEVADNLHSVKKVWVVASGKGGVGKSTVAKNLALGWAKKGLKVGLLDADIFGPSIPTLFGLENAQPAGEEKDGKTRLYPIEKDGIKLISIGFFVAPEKALLWRGPMASNALRQLFTEVEWGALDILLVDLPPGTSDVHITLAQTVPIDGAIVVTTPQALAVADVRKAIDMFLDPNIKIPVIGIVENMAYFTPPTHPDERYAIFGEGGAQKLAQEFQIPLLAQLPIQLPASALDEDAYEDILKTLV